MHAVAESESEKIAISVGPLSGRVTAKQIVTTPSKTRSLRESSRCTCSVGLRGERGRSEVRPREARQSEGRAHHDPPGSTLAEGLLKATQPEMLFSPLALPDIAVEGVANGQEHQVQVTLNGVALFDRKRRITEYKRADSGYVSAWYLDEDYDGDCFVDCQMVFDFKKAPNIEAALKAEVDPEEYTLKLKSEPFPVRGYKRIAVKVVDVFGNESTVVKDLE